MHNEDDYELYAQRNCENLWATVSDMPPRQVAAVYKSMKARGKFEKKGEEEEEYHQMNIFDYLFELKGEKVWEMQ